MNDYQHILAHLSTQPDTTILTPNRRLAATLHELYREMQIQAQQTSWKTPDILPLATWLQRLRDTYSSTHFTEVNLLLNATQERFLWEKILLQTKDSHQLLQVTETADLARTAWGLLKQWQVDLDLPLFKNSEDYLALHTWATKFHETCEQYHFRDTATVVDELCEFLQQELLPLPNKIQLVGFTEIAPQLEHFFSLCKKTNCIIETIELTRDDTLPQRISLADSEEELLTMARWAKDLQKTTPAARIACVVPALDKIRDRVQQIFSEVFAAENTYTVDLQSCAFNISAGKNLSQYPIIQAALELLHIFQETISLEKLAYLLVSPFLGEAELERLRRCSYELQLRRYNITRIDLRSACQNAEEKPFALPKSCPRLAERLRGFFAQLAQLPKEQSYSLWAKTFTELLTTLGWPGERSINSEEYQVVDHWLNLLIEYATLDQVSAPVNITQAWHVLQKMVAKSVFQAKTPTAPIQILGVLEAAGIPFDYIWVAGMDDISWPPQPKPNPFIPKSIQRELHMPHATAERELRFCTTIIKQFIQSAAVVIFSHAEKNQELELQASPLIRHIPSICLQDLNLSIYQSTNEKIFLSKNLELICDTVAPQVNANEKIYGGVSVLKQQALCPFKAFAEWRLHAHALETPTPGLRAKDRGTIIHKILELVWNQLNNHATLMNLADSELTQLIETCINATFTIVTHSRDGHPQYLNLEKKRLFQLMWDWLQIEKARPEFTVAKSEKTTEVAIGPLRLTIRIDRIDSLADGKKIIIDYKTGKNNDINTWFTDRPEEPQLPLYALLDRTNTSAISFAQIYQGEHGFKGVSKYAMDIKGIKILPEVKKSTALSWDEQLAQWNSILGKLSEDFYMGIACVDPKDPPETCEWCDLKPLCRVNEEVYCE